MNGSDNWSEAEYLADCEDLSLAMEDERQLSIEADIECLSKKTDEQLLDFITGCGARLNTLSTFKTYDIAKRLKKNKWTPTQKQRAALITTAAIALNTG